MSTSAFGVDHGGEFSKRKWGFDPDRRKQEYQTRAAAGGLGAISGGAGAVMGNQIGARMGLGTPAKDAVKAAAKTRAFRGAGAVAAGTIGASLALERHAKKTGTIRRVQPGETTGAFGRIKPKKAS